MIDATDVKRMQLTARHWLVLRSAMDRLVPADDFPSAGQAGVEGYFRKQFAGDLSGLVDTYAASLDALDAAAKGFVEADASIQDELLAQMERGELTGTWPEAPNIFFQRLLNHVMEGYYADPGNGGNLGAVSWTMVGFGGRKT